ncbi:hypothetical protein OFN07_03755 [Acinetobacter baumannii]|uniref:hypothetical protein n=1 Tax=Acinetobacter TaxID=469 RepID=UPI0002AE8561|nr:MULTISPECIES: hypothetical protein [Acinetobacter]EHU1357944.1 hypothetical protein [Acinetobacter baumannii]EHU3215320.1 hypothetical protein [Acinetobacter baumannii]ELX07744.1 hypothetical protein ACINNAV57_3481 [Acinetobacter baumannii Naval-57]MCS6740521.1 hypothetical protein [Acinetobacter baumannii]MDB0304023.1 hypothetical protein [Acinetobacter baumannii]
MKYFLIFIFVLLVVPVFIFGQEINLTEQFKIIENLKAIFAILFALFGIWIAICNPLTSDSEKLEKISFDKILEALFLCILSLIIIGFIFFLTPILKNINYIQSHKEMFRAILFVTVYLLTLIQVYTLIISLKPNDLIKDYLDKNNERKKLLNQRTILKK